MASGPRGVGDEEGWVEGDFDGRVWPGVSAERHDPDQLVAMGENPLSACAILARALREE